MAQETSNFDRRMTEGSVYIIAEAGSNHDGDINKAKKLIQIAQEAGADCVKFQSVTFETLTSDAENSELQKAVDAISLSRDWHITLHEECNKQGLDFISTPTYNEAADILSELKVPAIKIASMDLTNVPFLRYVASKNIPIIISRGMSSIAEIEIALDTIKSVNQGLDITLLHCIADYPSQPSDLNLRQLKTLKSCFDCRVGFSDHTVSPAIPSIAVALGAVVVEKHFTYDKNAKGFDHFYALGPEELQSMVENIRQTEAALGSSYIKVAPVELEVKQIAQRSIVASKTIQSGETLSPENLTTKRPGNGIPAINWDLVIGKKAAKDFVKNDMLSWENIK